MKCGLWMVRRRNRNTFVRKQCAVRSVYIFLFCYSPVLRTHPIRLNSLRFFHVFLFLLNLFFFYFILEKTFVSCSTCWTLECARKTQPAVQNRTFRSVQIKEKPTFPFNKCRLAYTVKFMGIYRPIGSINREPIPFCHFARIDEWRIENPIKLNNVWRNLVPLRVAAVI